VRATGAVSDIKVCQRSRIAELPSKIQDGFSRGHTLIHSTGTMIDVQCISGAARIEAKPPFSCVIF